MRHNISGVRYRGDNFIKRGWYGLLSFADPLSLRERIVYSLLILGLIAVALGPVIRANTGDSSFFSLESINCNSQTWTNPQLAEGHAVPQQRSNFNLSNSSSTLPTDTEGITCDGFQENEDHLRLNSQIDISLIARAGSVVESESSRVADDGSSNTLVVIEQLNEALPANKEASENDLATLEVSNDAGQTWELMHIFDSSLVDTEDTLSSILLPKDYSTDLDKLSIRIRNTSVNEDVSLLLEAVSVSYQQSEKTELALSIDGVDLVDEESTIPTLNSEGSLEIEFTTKEPSDGLLQGAVSQFSSQDSDDLDSVVKIKDEEGRPIVDVELVEEFIDSDLANEKTWKAAVPVPRNADPGVYSLELAVTDKKGGVSVIEQDFLWGVLAFNTNKTEYLANEEAEIFVSVLNPAGETVCDADLELSVVGPNGFSQKLSTREFRVSKLCQLYENHIEADYSSTIDLASAGSYVLELSASTDSGNYSTSKTIEVVNDYSALEVARVGPTRLYPPLDYPMIFEITAHKDFEGTFEEIVPSEFEVFENVIGAEPFSDVVYEAEETVLGWPLDLESGDVVRVGYSFNAPDISPEFYLLGPATAKKSNATAYSELGYWQLAGDAISDDFKVQRGRTSLAGTTTTITAGVDYDAPSSLSSAYIRINSTRSTGSGNGSGAGTQNADDVTAYISNPGNLLTSITFTRAGSGTTNTQVGWEIIEYQGDAAGGNEMIIRDQGTSTFVAGNLTLDTSTVSGASDDNDVVAWVTGLGSPDTGTADYNTSQVTSDWIGGGTDVGRFTREEAGGDAIIVSWAIVEFTGSNWAVQRHEHDYTAATDQTVSITAVNDLSRAFIYDQKRGNQPGLDDTGQAVWLSADDELTFRVEVNSGNQFGVAWVIENTQTDGTPMNVERNSFTRTGGAEPGTHSEAYGPITDLTVASVFANARSTGTGTAHPRGNFALQLTTTSNIEFFYSDNGQTQNGRWEVIEWPTAPVTTAFTEQIHYRWRNDTFDVNAGGGWQAAEDVAITDQAKGSALRVRINVANSGVAAEVAAKQYELEFGERTGATCSAISTWTGVADSGADAFDMFGSTHIDPDGESTTVGLLANTESYTFTNGEGRDSADTTGNIGGMATSNFTEIEYSIQINNAATSGATYCFRVYDAAAGSAIDEYDEYPSLSIASSTIPIDPYGEAGTFTSEIDGGWTVVNFENSYTTPVVVGTTNTVTGESALVFQSRNVGPTSAEMRVCESEGSTITGCDSHAAETVGYLVIDAARNADIDGLEAGTVSMSGADDSTNYTTNYAESFGSAPIVFANLNSDVDTEQPTEVIINSTTATNFNAGICEHLQGSDDVCDATHVAETVGWVAIEPGNEPFFGEHDNGTASVTNSSWTGITFSPSFTQTPVLIAASQNDTGGQDLEIDEARNITTAGAQVRYCEIDASDTCDTHATDTVAWAAFEEGSLYAKAIEFDQINYRYYENTDAIQPTTPIAAEDTTVSDVVGGNQIRIRMGVQISSGDLAIGEFSPKLQYGQGSTCTAIGTWFDVGAPGSSSTWRGFDNPTAADGATVTGQLLTASDENGTYEEQNDGASNPNAINSGDQGEWDWVIESNDADNGTDFCFRMALSDDRPITYSEYPQLTTLSYPTDIYIERDVSFNPTTANTWTAIDLNGPPYNIPSNSVVEIGLANGQINAARSMGVRETGSALERRLELREAEQGGDSWMIMHVMTDDIGEIEYFTSATGNSEFHILGFWESGTWVEGWTQINPALDNTWEDADLSGAPTNVPVNRVVEVVLANGEFNTENLAGVREDGTTIDRRIDIAEAENPATSFSTATMFAQADENSIIEVNAEDTSEMEFWYTGYWDVQPGHFFQAEVENIADATLDGTWQTRDLSGSPFNVPAEGIAEIQLSNGDINAEDFFGSRSDTAGLTRTYDIVEAEAGGYMPLRIHTPTNTSSEIQIFHEDVSDVPFDFFFTGHWEAPIAPDDPTSLDQTTTADVSLAVGDWINSTSLKFKSTLADTETFEALSICVEYQPLGTDFTNVDDSCSTENAYNGTNITGAELTITVPDQDEYHWQARVLDVTGTYSSYVSFGANAESARDFGIDTTAPTGGTVLDGLIAPDIEYNAGELDELSGNWSSFNNDISGLNDYDVSIGSTPGGTDILAWTSEGTSTTSTRGSLTLNTSQPYYFNVRANDNAGNTSAVVSSDGQFVAPSLSFSSTPSSIDLGDLNAGNSFTGTGSTTLTTSTNAYNGYIVRGWATNILQSQSLDTIGMFTGGSYVSPDEWLGGDTGYGYNSSDNDIQGSNIFNNNPCPGGGVPPCYAPWSLTAPGDIVADNTSAVSGSPISNEDFTISHRVTAPSTQEAGEYSTVIIYTITAIY